MGRFLFYVILFYSFHGISQVKYSISSIPKDLVEGANSVLLDEFVQTDVTDLQKMTVTTMRAVAVLNAKGQNNVGAYESYDAEKTIKNIEAYVYDAFGNEKEHFKKRDFKDQSRTDGFSMYLDDRVLYLDYTPTSYPYIMVFKSETITGDTAFLPAWYPIGNFARGTSNSVSSLLFDPVNKPRFLASNIEGFDITLNETANSITWTAKNIAPLKYEEYSESFQNIAPHVKFALNNFYLKGKSGQGKDWQQFGSWMNDALLQNTSELPQGTIDRVKNMVSTQTTIDGKARIIYQFVQDKVRYISVQIGIGGWKPMLAADVDKLAYGDCKALTNYTKALLDAVGVPSYYTIISAGESEKDITNNFTAMQGNHAILGVPVGDEITWLECTSQDAPYGYMGNFTDDRDVLIVTPEGGKIVHTKTYATAENTKTTTANILLQQNGILSAKLNTISTGLEYDDVYMLPKQKKDVIEKYYKNKWSYINGLVLDKIDFENNKRDIIFSENVWVTMPNYLSSVNDGLLICPNVFSLEQEIPPRISSRKNDLFLPNGSIQNDELTIVIPENYTFNTLPDAVKLETKFGTYNVIFSKTNERELKYSRTLQMDKGTFPPEDYEAFRDFKRQIARFDKTKILIQPN